MRAGLARIFGAAEDPNELGGVTVQAAGLAAPGSLVEIELTAAKSPR